MERRKKRWVAYSGILWRCFIANIPNWSEPRPFEALRGYQKVKKKRSESFYFHKQEINSVWKDTAIILKKKNLFCVGEALFPCKRVDLLIKSKLGIGAFKRLAFWLTHWQGSNFNTKIILHSAASIYTSDLSTNWMNFLCVVRADFGALNMILLTFIHSFIRFVRVGLWIMMISIRRFISLAIANVRIIFWHQIKFHSASCAQNAWVVLIIRHLFNRRLSFNGTFLFSFPMNYKVSCYTKCSIWWYSLAHKSVSLDLLGLVSLSSQSILLIDSLNSIRWKKTTRKEKIVATNWKQLLCSAWMHADAKMIE